MEEERLKKIEKLVDRYHEKLCFNKLECKSIMIEFAQKYREVWQ